MTKQDNLKTAPPLAAGEREPIVCVRIWRAAVKGVAVEDFTLEIIVAAVDLWPRLLIWRQAVSKDSTVFIVRRWSHISFYDRRFSDYNCLFTTGAQAQEEDARAERERPYGLMKGSPLGSSQLNCSLRQHADLLVSCSPRYAILTLTKAVPK